MVAQPDLQQLAQAVGHISLERQKEMEAERRQSEISGITLMGESAVVGDFCRWRRHQIDRLFASLPSLAFPALTTDVAARPDAGGTAGRKVPVTANLYLLNIGNAANPAASGGRGGGRGGARGGAARGGGASNVPNFTIFHYDVVIKPHREEQPAPTEQTAEGGEEAKPPRAEKPLPINLLRSVFKMALFDAAADPQNPLNDSSNKGIAFDGRCNAYSAVKLPFEQYDWLISLPERGASVEDPNSPRDARRRFKVTMRQVNVIDGTKLFQWVGRDLTVVRAAGAAVPEIIATTLQAIQVAICHDPASRFKVHGGGGKRFFDVSSRVPIPKGAEIWKGFFQSVRPCQAGVMVNM